MNYQSINWQDYIGRDSIVESEKIKREAFSIFYTTPDDNHIKKNMQTLQELKNSSIQNQTNLLSNFNDISNNIQEYNDTVKLLSKNNNIYHYDDNLSSNVLLKIDEPNNIQTVLQKDINQLNLYQNSIYITSSIACATLLITAIMIVPFQK